MFDQKFGLLFTHSIHVVFVIFPNLAFDNIPIDMD